MPKAQKVEAVEELKVELRDSQAALLTSFRGPKVAEMTESRRARAAPPTDFHAGENPPGKTPPRGPGPSPSPPRRRRTTPTTRKNNAEEEGMANTQELLEAIGGMTVLELSEFVKAFEDRFGVTAAAPVAIAAGPAGPAAAAAEP